MISPARIALALTLLACDGPAPTPDAGVGEGAVVAFDLSGPLDRAETFYDFPFPSDLRLSEEGTPILTGYPNPRVSIVEDLRRIAEERPGWPVRSCSSTSIPPRPSAAASTRRSR